MKANGHSTWDVICDVCGFKFRSNEVLKRWDNLIVCRKDWEQRHPQELIRAIPDDPTPPFVRPEPADVFSDVTYSVSPGYCDVIGRRGIAGYGIAGCMVAGSGF